MSKGLTVRDLARRANYGGSTLFDIEDGKRFPSRELAERLADALDLPDASYRELLEAVDPDADLLSSLEGGPD